MSNPGYVRSTDGSDADDGSTWALANATLVGAYADAAAGDRIYVSDNHSESTVGSITLTSPGTAASPCQVLCGDDAAEPPTALAATAVVAATGGAAITFAGFTYYYGIDFQAGSGGSGSGSNINVGNVSPSWTRLENCVLSLLGTNANNRINLGAGVINAGDDMMAECIDTDFVFASASQGIKPAGHVLVRGGVAAPTGTVPTTLVLPGADSYFHAVFRGVDLSALGSGNNLVDVGGASASGKIIFENCKLGASVALTTGSVAGQGGVEVEVINCDSADTNYRYCKKVYQGEITHETTIVRTGGASDGTTAISRKMVSSANSKFYSPLVLDSVVLWNEDTGVAKTVTVEIVTDNVTLTDAECWVEVEYLGTAGFPVSSFASDRAADILATPANQASSTESWTTTGLATPVKQKLSVSFTPQEKGPVRVRVMLAKASTTVYVDPPTELT